MAVSKNLLLNNPLKRQHQRQSREPSRPTAANGVGAEEVGAGTRARALAQVLPQRPSPLP
jgi:hypothetical protein